MTNEEALAALSKSEGTLEERVAKAGVDGRRGWVLHAGNVADGTFDVDFGYQGDGWSSRWPAWAYERARGALLHGKKLHVISNGLPYASNLLLVLVRHEAVEGR